ncbi:AAA family ATPase [Arcobacter sp. L]|uniref:AAA family ATPase n=1 Tax=Arcobacter sp. L TaxID=944547 RepID=UPI00022965B3|nr:AAA family ATPase [Arcobacter sp. L]BAK72105.1 conserved hypothetical protein [Arcobacter sp. L]
MELIYLWVEEYKNIEKQGFNFSPRFRCKYDEEKNELEIIDKDKTGEFYPKNFFGDNINVTAIVGKNGAGKSTLLISIIGAIFQNGYEQKNANWREFKKLILVFNDSEDRKIFTFSGIKNQETQEFELFHILNQKTLNLYEDYKCCKPNSYLHQYYYLLFDFSIGQQEIWNDSSNYKINFALEPSRIYLGTGGGNLVTKIDPVSFDSTMKSNAVYFYKYIYDNNLEEFLKIFNLPSFQLLHHFGKSSMRPKIRDITFKELQADNINAFGINFNTLNNWDEINQYIERYVNSSMSIQKLTENDLLHFDRLLIYSKLELESNDNLFFRNLSTGQQLLISYLGIIVRLHLKTKHLNKRVFNILIDEIETSLHPNWQRMFLVFIINFLTESKISSNYKCINIIVCTHSPFILSDLPKENVVFLKDGAQVDIDINTFGANIHTLLTHGFFMEDGLMGEFAKSKIDKAIEYLNQKSLTKEELDYCENIISIIGEPIIKRELQRMIDSKRLSKIDKIDEIEKQIEELQKELKKIKYD